jgi:hypothetical protein
MSPELDKALCTAYPLIFKERNRKDGKWPISWGFEFGDGWYGIIDTLCAMLYWPYSAAEERHRVVKGLEGKPPSAGSKLVTADDVKKAEVEMVAARKLVPVCRQAKEKFGGLRFHVNKSSEVQAAYVDFAERMSARTCEECGAPGKLRTGGWLRTLCDTHEAERVATPAGSAESKGEGGQGG